VRTSWASLGVMAPLGPSLIVPAPAKVNLALAVGPPRPQDGFHPICSWFVPVTLRDEVEALALAAGSESSLASHWAPDAPRPSAIDWPASSDLAFRARAVLSREAGRDLPARLTIRKRVPVGGGLGGGSSDAAAALLALRRVFALDVPEARLQELSRELGSDVAFFCRDTLSPALVEGLGEQLTPTPALTLHLVLIFPPFGCPTGAVYKAFDRSSLGHGPDATPELFEARAAGLRRVVLNAAEFSLEELDAALFNDLAAPAEHVEPRLAHVRQDASRALGGRRVHVTGSGSTLFTLAGSEHDAQAGAHAVQSQLPGVAALASRTMPPAGL